MKKIILLFIFILPFQLSAETLFVGDTLRVGIRAEPSKSVPSISVIKTGAAVEILERKNSYARIRTKNGIEGWVKSAYLSRKTPANKKLQSANKKIKNLEKELVNLRKNDNKQSNQKQQQLQTTIKQLQTEKNVMLKEIAQLKTSSKSTVEEKIPALGDLSSIKLGSINKDLLYLILGAIIAILTLGFVFGVSWYKQQVTKRLGGLSI